jgi:hypothetical protein
MVQYTNLSPTIKLVSYTEHLPVSRTVSALATRSLYWVDSPMTVLK